MKKLSLNNDRRGMALAIILGLTACLGVWIVSVSWNMMTGRSQYQKMLKTKRAYFMARSGMEHLLLKIKVMQRHCPQSIRAMENANENEKKMLYNIFLEDILIPADKKFSGDIVKYLVTDFEFESVDLDRARFTLNVGVTGVYEGHENKISRLMRISR